MGDYGGATEGDGLLSVAACQFAFGVGRVGFATLHVGLHIDWRNHAYLVTAGADLPRPVMRT